MTSMTPDKVEAALVSLKQVSAAIACPDLPRRTRADESRWAATITDALSVLTEALAESRRDAARYRWLRDFAHPDADSSGVAVTEQWFTDWGRPYTHHFSGDQLDAAIDTAMKETP